MAEDWELESEAACFPTAGEEYILRPENRIQPVLRTSKGGHEYTELRVSMHIYQQPPPYDSQTPFHVLRVSLYPDQMREFTGGRWNDAVVYKVKCQTDGRKKFLHIMEKYPFHRDAPTSSPPTAAGPISPPGQGVGVSPSAPTPSPGNAQGEAAEGLCACGREAVAMQFQMGPNKGQVWCTKCGRRVA